jgi:hypothetical protein
VAIYCETGGSLRVRSETFALISMQQLPFFTLIRLHCLKEEATILNPSKFQVRGKVAVEVDDQ